MSELSDAPFNPRYASVVLDVDSTLCGVEGVDWLAAQRGPAVGMEVARLTQRAMNGELDLASVYGRRLAIIRPAAPEIASLALAYRRALAPGAPAAVARLVRHGVRVVLVSGGIRQAILPIAAGLRLPPADVHAVTLRFDATGGYAGFDEASPLATHEGKRALVERLALPRPVLAVGDGATDLAMRGAVDAFAAFTGFVRRDAVVAAADLELPSFDRLVGLVLP